MEDAAAKLGWGVGQYPLIPTVSKIIYNLTTNVFCGKKRETEFYYSQDILRSTNIHTHTYTHTHTHTHTQCTQKKKKRHPTHPPPPPHTHTHTHTHTLQQS